MGHGVDKGAEGLVQPEGNGVGVVDDQFLHRLHEAGTLVVSGHEPRDVHANGFGIKGGSVVERDSLSEREGELGGGIVEAVTFGQKRDQVEILVESHEPLHHGPLDGAGVGVRGVVRIEGFCRRIRCVDDVLSCSERRPGHHEKAEGGTCQAFEFHLSCSLESVKRSGDAPFGSSPPNGRGSGKPKGHEKKPNALAQPPSYRSKSHPSGIRATRCPGETSM